MAKKLKLLWVDDDRKSIDHWTKSFEIFGFHITPASNISEAMAVIEANSFDLLIVDLELSERMSGLDLVSKIRAKDNIIPIFILSAYTRDTRYLHKIDKLKLDGIIEKPLPADKKSLEEIFLKLELSCQEADLIKLQGKYKNIRNRFIFCL